MALHCLASALHREKSLAVFVILVLCTACVSNSSNQHTLIDRPQWMLDAENYRDTLANSHPDQIENLFFISDELREIVQSKFGSLPQPTAAMQLAKWLVDEQGHGMVYDVDANLSPIQAFKKRRGNCLSFTILLTELAAELGISIKYNEVDMPNTWAVQENNSFVLYRHVNGIFRTFGQTHVFDLAMASYDYNYPQRVITKELAAAKLLSNLGITALGKNDLETAQHYLMLAISLAPTNGELWVNFGVINKRQGDLKRAEQAFIHGLSLDRYSSVAASNLERLYRSTGRKYLAKRYQRLAQRLRKTNPYYHYNAASEFYTQNQLKDSRRAIRKAIKLHKLDPKFYELSSRLYQREDNLAKAFDELRVAHELSKDLKKRGRYALKAIRINELAMQSARSN